MVTFSINPFSRFPYLKYLQTEPLPAQIRERAGFAALLWCELRQLRYSYFKVNTNPTQLLGGGSG